MACGIYCIERIETGQKYIGQGKNVEKRMMECHKECKYIYNSIKKHGKENFDRSVIIYCEEWELPHLEMACIKAFHSHVSEGGYNISWGGDAPMMGVNHSDETKKLMSENHWDTSGKNHPMYGKIGENNPNYGSHRSEETRKLMSESHKNPSDKARKLMSESHKNPSDETRKRMSEALSGENNPMYGKIGENNPRFGTKLLGASSQLFGVYKLNKKVKDNLYVYWDAIISENGKRKTIGSYKTELDAALAYNKYITEHNLPNPLNNVKKEK